MKKGVLIFWVAILVLIVLGVGASFIPARRTGPLDSFTQCLADSGAVFYGAFWCPHCQAQKRIFGASARLLPYVECSTPDGQGQLQACTDKGVRQYPTWTFAGTTTVLTGERTLEELASITGCPLPN